MTQSPFQMVLKQCGVVKFILKRMHYHFGISKLIFPKIRGHLVLRGQEKGWIESQQGGGSGKMGGQYIKCPFTFTHGKLIKLGQRNY